MLNNLIKATALIYLLQLLFCSFSMQELHHSQKLIPKILTINCCAQINMILFGMPTLNINLIKISSHKISETSLMQVLLWILLKDQLLQKLKSQTLENNGKRKTKEQE